MIKNGWSVVYKSCYNPDGSLFFPEKLSHDELIKLRKSMGSIVFANQYENKILSAEDQIFKPQWLQFFDEPPELLNIFIAIDPAISQSETADFTGVSIVGIDHENQRWVLNAERLKLTPTQIITLAFNLNDHFKPMAIGIEAVAYQKALLYMIDDEMKRRKKVIPVTEIKTPTNKSKEARIMSLVPWLEWGRMKIRRGLFDLENELLQFPRGAHDDIIDSLAMIDFLAFKPELKEQEYEKPNSASNPNYEKWFISQLKKGKKPQGPSYE